MYAAKSLPRQGLYAITHCRILNTEQLLSKTEQILQGGVAMLQYRHKDADAELQFIQASMLRKLCAQYGIPFIINDDPELARLLHADGVHLGREDMDCRQARELLGPDSIIGVSCYNESARVKTAVTDGASYIALGAFYPTQTKSDAIRAEPGLIGRIKQILTLPVVAIGGITPENGQFLVEAGADFLAVSSGLYEPADTCQAVQNYMTLFKQL